jgi:lysophospholipase L1-like esterase
MTGPICKSKHTVFRWKGDKTRKATLICDSLGKWFRAMANTDTQAIPGLNLDRAALRIIDGTLSVNNYTTILVMIGTNDVEEFDPQQITEKLAYLLDIIKARNPSAIIAYNAIIFRPRDIPEQMVEIERMYRLGANYTPPPPPPPPEKPLTAQQKYDALPVMEKKRREINKEIRKYCNANNILFLQSWLKMQKADKTVNLALYARDGIHLNEAGTHTLRIHIEGNAGALINRNQKCLPI